jgi:hypothetical protein
MVAVVPKLAPALDRLVQTILTVQKQVALAHQVLVQRLGQLTVAIRRLVTTVSNAVGELNAARPLRAPISGEGLTSGKKFWLQHAREPSVGRV